VAYLWVALVAAAPPIAWLTWRRRVVGAGSGSGADRAAGRRGRIARVLTVVSWLVLAFGALRVG
jgi:hypothetical protein